MENKKHSLFKILWIAGAVIASAMAVFLSAGGRPPEDKTVLAAASAETATENQIDLLKQDLTQISGYLDQMDGTMTASHESLLSVTAESGTFSARYETLEQQLTALSQSVEDARAGLQESHAEARRLLSDAHTAQSDSHAALEKILSGMTADIAAARKKLEQSGKDILAFLEAMDSQQKTEQEEEILFIQQICEEITALISGDMTQLTSDLADESGGIRLLIENKTLDLFGQMTDLQDRIHAAQEEAVLMLSQLAQSAEARQEEIQKEIQKEIMIEIQASFSSLQESLAGIQAYYQQMQEEIKDLFYEATESSAENHAELISVLGTMETQMAENSQAGLSMIKESIERLDRANEAAVSSLSDEIADGFQDIDSAVGSQFGSFDTRISSRFDELNTAMENSFFSISETVNSGDDGLREFITDSFTQTNSNMENAMNEVNSQLQAVFQSVNSGKRLLASALFTKGISTGEDATFQQLYQAILDIPQELLIGVQEIPGTVTYDYHYHTDSAGNTVHEGSSNTYGGCFTVPSYHRHTGSSVTGGGCYTKPAYHAHVSRCYTTSRCNRSTSKVVGGKWVDHYMHGHVYVYELQCPAGHVFSSWGESSGNCTASVTSLSCGLTESHVVGYTLGCGKDENTVEYYNAGCGFSDGQITGAHILYSQPSQPGPAATVAADVPSGPAAIKEEAVPPSPYPEQEENRPPADVSGNALPAGSQFTDQYPTDAEQEEEDDDEPEPD